MFAANNYGMLEANKLLSQMMRCVSLPTTTEADSLEILNRIWNGPGSDHLHLQAAKGFKEAGLSVDLYGKEDMEIAKEAADMWWERVPSTLGNYANMRAKLNAELEDLEETLGISRWPLISRRRFVDAWQKLRNQAPARAPLVAAPTYQPIASHETQLVRIRRRETPLTTRPHHARARATRARGRALNFAGSQAHTSQPWPLTLPFRPRPRPRSRY